jgi:serine protease Do
MTNLRRRTLHRQYTLLCGLLALLLLLTAAAPPSLSGRADRLQEAGGRAEAPPAALDKPVPENVADLRAIQERVQKVLARVVPCTVAVRIGPGNGSGVIVSKDGYVLTAGHVAGVPDRDVDIILSDGHRVRGKTLGINYGIDSGLIRITGEKRDWPFAEMGDASKLKAGQWCLALGHPGGYRPGRTPPVRLGRVLVKSDRVLRTDCALVGGDSGGPLFDLDGKVIGIHTSIGGSMTFNLHVPVDTYRATWDRLAKGERWGARDEGPYLGFEVDPDADGIKVLRVERGSPAEKAGLKADDVLLRFDSEKVSNFEQLRRLIQRRRPGTEVTLEVRRGDGVVTLKAVIGKRDTESSHREDFQILDRPGAADDRGRNDDPEIPLKNSPKFLAAFREAVAGPAKSTVRILCGGKHAALGTVVSPDGLILTKASELKGAAVCRLRNGQEFPARVVGVHGPTDLALLKIDARSLTPVTWQDSGSVPVGSWLATPGMGETAVAVGVLSVAARKVSPRELARPNTSGGYLGITIAPVKGGVKITEVTPRSAASRAGLEADDRILAVGDKTIEDGEALRTALGKTKPGDVVTLRVRRGDEELEMKARLGRRPPDRAEFQNGLGSELSAHRYGFPTILQHDTVLRPADCGGPVVDLDGKVIGVNIARAGRTETFAIPAEVVRPLLKDLESGKLAPPRAEASGKSEAK